MALQNVVAQWPHKTQSLSVLFKVQKHTPSISEDNRCDDGREAFQLLDTLSRNRRPRNVRSQSSVHYPCTTKQKISDDVFYHWASPGAAGRLVEVQVSPGRVEAKRKIQSATVVIRIPPNPPGDCVGLIHQSFQSFRLQRTKHAKHKSGYQSRCVMHKPHRRT